MILTIIVTVIAIGIAIGVCVHSYKQNRDEKKPKMNFILELFNHFGDGSNYKR